MRRLCGSLHALGVAVLLATGVMLGACTAPEPSVEAPLQSTLDSLRAADGFPGATAAVVMPDGALHAAATAGPTAKIPPS